MQKRKCGGGASGCKEDANEHFFRTETTQPVGESNFCVYSGEVGERRGGDDRVVFAGGRGHAVDDEHDHSDRGADRGREKVLAMAPMEEMAIVQCCEITRVYSSASIKEPVKDVYGPRASRQQEQDPRFEMNVSASRDGESPDDRNRGCIETREMPQAQNPPGDTVQDRVGYGTRATG